MNRDVIVMVFLYLIGISFDRTFVDIFGIHIYSVFEPKIRGQVHCVCQNHHAKNGCQNHDEIECDFGKFGFFSVKTDIVDIEALEFKVGIDPSQD